MEADKVGRQNWPPAELEQIGSEITGLCAAWARNIELKLFRYEEELRLDSIVAQWISIAQNAALSSHTYILEDGPELPKVPGPRADEGGKVLKGCRPMAARRSMSRES
jgi:hypothetical protein